MIGFTISIEFALQRAMMHASRAAGGQRIAPDQFTGLHPKGGWTHSFGTYLRVGGQGMARGPVKNPDWPPRNHG